MASFIPNRYIIIELALNSNKHRSPYVLSLGRISYYYLYRAFTTFAGIQAGFFISILLPELLV
jgi:hypothetical protein